MSKTKHSFVNIGFSSILTVFFTVCLVTFAALSLLTANSDNKLSQKVADRTTAYYNADSTAQSLLAEIDEILATHYLESEDQDSYFRSLSAEKWDLNYLSSSQTISYFTLSDGADGDLYLNYAIAISDQQELEVSLKLLYPQASTDYFYQIVSWKTCTIDTNDSTESSYHLYTGN